MIEMFRKKLLGLGLTDKEATVYLALLRGGEITAEQLAKLSKLNRSTTYVQIKSLSDHGLVSTFKRGKKTFYAAESPSNLERLIEHRSAELEHQRSEVTVLVPELLKLFGSSVDRPTVRVFEGKEGLTSMRNEMLDANPKVIQVAFSFDAMTTIFSDAELLTFSKKRAGKQIHSQALYTKDGEDIEPLPPQKLKRIHNKNYSFGSDIYIYGDTVSYTATKGQIVGVTIKNASIADTMRTLFEIAWKHAD